MVKLRQSTAQTIKMGPFVDATDGDTEETALTIATTDVLLSKDGGGFAAQDSGATAPAHDVSGMYTVNLTATDTNTLGELEVYIHVSGALYVKKRFEVVPANVYDSLVAGSDNLQTDAIEISSSPTAADNVEANIANLDATVSSRATQAEILSDATPFAGANVDAAISTRATPTEVKTQADQALVDIHLDHIFATDYDPSVPPGVATALFNELVEDDGGGVSRFTVGALNQAWSVSARVLTANTNLNDPTAATIADAIWDEATVDHTGAGSFGEEVQLHALSSEISALNDPSSATIADAVWDEDIVAAHGTSSTAGLLLRALGAAISTRTNNANLNALLGVVDSAGEDVPSQILTGETLSELAQGQPAATPTVAQSIMLLYMAMRNAEEQDGSEYRVHDDAGTTVSKAALSDDGSVTTKDKMVSGP